MWLETLARQKIERFPMYGHFNAFSGDDINAWSHSVQFISILTCFSAVGNSRGKWNDKEHLPSACVFDHDPF